MTDPFDSHNEMEENVQVRRWSRLLSWLESHGMDLSPSAFNVECRPRPGIPSFIPLTPKADICASLNNTGAGYGLFLANPCPVGRMITA